MALRALFAGAPSVPGGRVPPALLISDAVALFALLLPRDRPRADERRGRALRRLRRRRTCACARTPCWRSALAAFAVALFVIGLRPADRGSGRGEGVRPPGGSRMDLIANLATGFSVALTPANLGFCFLGALIGTLVGVLPGIAPITTIAILLPFTFTLPPASSLIMLAGIFYGAQYGGSTTAILVNVPGKSSAIVTCLDGHQMAQQGRAGPALAIAAIASFVAGTIATLVIATASAPMTWLALKFNAPEYFSLMVLGLTGAVVLAHGAPEQGGRDGAGRAAARPRRHRRQHRRAAHDLRTSPNSATASASCRSRSACSASPSSRSRSAGRRTARCSTFKLGNLWPSRAELRACMPAMLRGTALGSVLGVLPGGGAALSSFAAYALEKKSSKTPERFGRGAIEGVAAPGGRQQRRRADELHPAAHARHPRQRHHGADGRRHDDPGHPARAAGDDEPAAAVLGRDRLDVARQPDADRAQPAADRAVGVAAARALPADVPGDRAVLLHRHLFGRQQRVRRLGDAAVRRCSACSSIKVGAEPAPFILGFILGPLMEENFRRAMMLSRGDPMVFLERPISAGLLILSAVLFAVLVSPALRSGREKVFQE